MKAEADKKLFESFKSRGLSDIDAEHEARQWEKRQHQDRWNHCCNTHCERTEECREPHDCCASLKAIRSASHLSSRGIQ